ncbi:hypothetical protein [Paenibacillus mucilaginosus]|uniref:hypothetical protein n=1 Tax=Paenibacillus mucilaginosus TaxID=61624 RepID=UPI003D22F050
MQLEELGPPVRAAQEVKLQTGDAAGPYEPSQLLQGAFIRDPGHLRCPGEQQLRLV